MLDRYWYDKIASAEEAAALAAEDAMAKDAMAADEDAAAAIEEDIAIAEAVSESDLPTEVKVAIMEDHDVAPEIIEEVINADAVEKVSSFYGINPYWLSDKLAAKKGKPSVSQKDYNALMEKYKTLQGNFGDLNQQAGILRGEKIDMRNAFDRKYRNLQDEFGKLNQQAGVLRGEKIDLTNSLNKLQGKYDTATRDLAARTKRVADMEALYGTLQGKHQRATERLTSAMSTIKQYQNELKASQDQVAQLGRSLTGKENTIRAAAQKMRKMKGGLYGLGTLAALGLAGTGYGLYKANEAERPWYQKIMG